MKRRILMSKRCPDCGFVNEDSRIYCSSCGELLDAELRLIKDLDAQTSGPKKPTYKAPPPRREPIPPRDFYDENYSPNKLAQKKKKSSAPWVFLGLAIAAVIVWLVISYAV